MLSLNLRTSCWLFAFIALSACRRPVEKDFEVSTDGASRTGLVETSKGVLVGNETGFLTLISADGKIAWRSRLDREVSARPVVVGDTVVATTRGGEWVGVSLADGSVRWRVAGQPVVLTPLATDGQRVFLVLPDLEIRAIDPATGENLWVHPAPKFAPKSRALQLPAVAGELLVLAQHEGGVRAYRRDTGALAWGFPVLPAAWVVADATTIYGISVEGTVSAIDLNGSKKWEQPLDRPFPGAPALAGDRLYVPAGGEVVALATKDGARAWSAELPTPGVAVTAAEGAIFVPTSDPTGRVFVFHPPSAEPIANLRLDSALRSPPVSSGGRVLLLGSDGRVVGFRVKVPGARSE